MVEEKAEEAAQALSCTLGLGRWQLPLRDSESSHSLKREIKPESCSWSGKSLCYLANLDIPSESLGVLIMLCIHYLASSLW